MDKITKLSDAIRLGATFREQRLDACVSDANKSCALEAAAEAIGWEKNCWGFLADRWPELGMKGVWCPACGTTLHGQPLMVITYHLNDTHHWTREEIADWLAQKGL